MARPAHCPTTHTLVRLKLDEVIDAAVMQADTADQDLASNLNLAAGKTIKYNGTAIANISNHTALSNIGTNTHAQIDTHIADTGNPHGTSDANLTVTDVTTNNVTEDFHGFVPKATNEAGKFLAADGTWDIPAGSGDMLKTDYDDNADDVVNEADYAADAGDADTVDGSHAADFAPAAQGVTSGNSHDHTGGDGGPILETSITLADNTTLNVSSVKHGLCPKCTNEAGKFLNASGAYATPAGAGDMLKATYDTNDDGRVNLAVDSDTVDGSHAAAFAVSAKGVTNGDSHDHSGGDGAAIVEAAITLADNTTNNCSTSKHGFLKKLDNSATHYMNGQGAWTTPTVAALGEPVFPKFTVAKVGSYYHVLNEYGALINSYSDAEVALNDEALNGLDGVGGLLYIKDGDYPITEQIIIPDDHIHILGESTRARLYLPNSQPTSDPYQRVIRADDVEHCSIKGLTLDGNYANNNWVAAKVGVLHLYNCKHFEIANNLVINGRQIGILTETSSGTDLVEDVIVHHNKALECKWNGIEFMFGDGVDFQGCKCHDNYVRGSNDIAVNSGIWAGDNGDIHDIIFADNIINGAADTYDFGSSGASNSRYGIKLEGTGSKQKVRGNTIYNVKTGVSDDAGTDGYNEISGNTITAIEQGIAIYSPYNTLDNNQIFCGFTAWLAGININADNNTISNNHIFNIGQVTNSVAIATDGNPNDGWYHDNDVVDDFDYPLVVNSGTGNTIVNNRLNGVFKASGV